MRKQILISLAILLSAIAYCQSGSTDQNFQKGKKAFKAEKYQEALAYFSISIGERQPSEAYYYRSMTYDKLGDSCNSCKDLRKASFINEQEYLKLFNQKCIACFKIENVPDTLKKLYPEITKLKIVHYKCISDTVVFGIIGQEPKTNEIELNLSVKSREESNNEPIYTIVEKMPSYPGGENAKNRFLAENIDYPSKATSAGIQGTVYISFIIDGEGFVTDVKVLRGIGGGCDEEAVRVVKLMPKWIPGKQNGKTVRVLFNMPIFFGLSG